MVNPGKRQGVRGWKSILMAIQLVKYPINAEISGIRIYVGFMQGFGLQVNQFGQHKKLIFVYIRVFVNLCPKRRV
jgi:hypothetical protein